MITESKTKTRTSVDLEIQKRLAKLILDVKYQNNMNQTCVDMLLLRFRGFFNEAIQIFEESPSSNVSIDNIYVFM